MKGLDNPTWLLLYIISNTVAILVLVMAWRIPRLARLMFVLLFMWAGITNWRTVLATPEEYLGQADLTFFTFYSEFIRGWFSRHITLSVGFIATCQLVIAISMILKGRLFMLAGIGAIIFLLSIAPFGVGSAFPCTILLAVAMFLIIRRKDHRFLWEAQIAPGNNDLIQDQKPQ